MSLKNKRKYDRRTEEDARRSRAASAGQGEGATLDAAATEEGPPAGAGGNDAGRASSTASNEVQKAELVGNKFTLSEATADNGEHFYQNENGNIDLVDIPQEVFDVIDYKKAPLRLTPSMITHMIGRHSKETGANDVDNAIGFILDVMNNFDHVRLGYNGALIFSIENGREKTGKRAISILLSSKTGDFYGIVSSGYEGVDRLKKRPQLWAGSAMITPATDSATEPVTTLDARQDGEQIGSASGQSGLSSAGKVMQKIDNHQEKEQKFSGEGENSSVVPGINRPEGEVLKLMGYDVQLYYNDVAPETSYMRSSSRFAQTGRYLSLDYLTGIKDKPTRFF